MKKLLLILTFFLSNYAFSWQQVFDTSNSDGMEDYNFKFSHDYPNKKLNFDLVKEFYGTDVKAIATTFNATFSKYNTVTIYTESTQTQDKQQLIKRDYITVDNLGRVVELRSIPNRDPLATYVRLNGDRFEVVNYRTGEVEEQYKGKKSEFILGYRNMTPAELNTFGYMLSLINDNVSRTGTFYTLTYDSANDKSLLEESYIYFYGASRAESAATAVNIKNKVIIEQPLKESAYPFFTQQIHQMLVQKVPLKNLYGYPLDYPDYEDYSKFEVSLDDISVLRKNDNILIMFPRYTFGPYSFNPVFEFKYDDVKQYLNF